MKSTKPFTIIGINHIGIAAKNPDLAFNFFKDVIGSPFVGDELVEDQNTLTRMFNSSETSTFTEQPRIELLAQGREDLPWPIRSFMEKKGGGIHHIALTVSDLVAALNYMKKNGVELVDESPRSGAHNTRIAFLHPRSTGGILVELVQG